DGLEAHAWSRVTVRLRDGRTLTAAPRGARGHPDTPLDPDALRAKYLACATRVLTIDEAEGIADQLAHLEDIPEIRALTSPLSGFGQDGPYRDYPAHDMNYLSLAGVLNLIGEPGRKPVIPLNLVADYAGAGMHGALGIVLALFARERTGRGQHVDVSYLDTSVSLLAATPNMRFFFSDGLAPRRGERFLGCC